MRAPQGDAPGLRPPASAFPLHAAPASVRSPLFAAVTLAIVALLATAGAAWLFGPRDEAPRQGSSPTPVAAEAPWQVRLGPDGGSSVFGMRLPGTRLGDLQTRWGDPLQVAILVPADGQAQGPASLEAMVERFAAAGVTGRLALAFGADAVALDALRRAVPGTPTGTGSRRHLLDAKQVQGLAAAPLIGVSFLPTARIDPDTLRQRFGVPADRRLQADGVEHWLYPEQGLSIAGDAKGRQVLQYVAPADFDRLLRQPLGSLPQVSGPAVEPAR